MAREEAAGGQSATLHVAWKVWHTGDPTTAAFVWGDSVRSVWGCVALSGYDPDRPIDIAYSQFNAAPLPRDSPSAFGRHNGSLAIMALCSAENTVVSHGGALTGLFDRQTASISMAAGYKASSEGAVGGESFGGTGNFDSLSCTIVVNADYTVPTLGPSAFSAAVMALGPAGYWRLADEVGLTANDEVGSNDGTWAGHNVMPFDRPVFSGLPAMAGFSRISALFFTADNNVQGSRARIALPSVSWWPSTPNVWSIMAVIQQDLISGRQSIFGASGTSGKPQLEVGVSGNLQALIEGTFLWNTPTDTILPGVPYFVVISRNGAGSTNYKCWVNAVDITLSSTAASNNTSGAFVGLIGARTTTSQAFGGRISDVALFTDVLTQAEVESLYALLGSTPPSGEPRFDSWWN